MNTKTLLFFITTFVILSCKKPSMESETKTMESVSKDYITTNSPAWAGTYKGTIPCKYCEGIEVELTLRSDSTYLYKTNYMGRNDALETEDTGMFTWHDSASTITLSHISEGPNQFKFEDGRIWCLDLEGNVVTGKLASHYVLTKR